MYPNGAKQASPPSPGGVSLKALQGLQVRLLISAGQEGGSCNVAMLSAVVWPGAMAPFRLAAAPGGIPAASPHPDYPKQAGDAARMWGPSPPRLVWQLLDGAMGVPALEYYFEGVLFFGFFFSFFLDRFEM